MSKVMVRNGNVDGALRIMKQQNVKDGNLKKIKERELGFLKRGVKNRIAKEEGKKNARKRERLANR